MNRLPHGCALRRATPADIDNYAAISRRTFADTYRGTHSAEVLERHVGARFTEEALRIELSDATREALVVTRGDAWVGYVLLHEGAPPSDVHGSHPVEVERFYVDADWHGRGVARPLMEAALDAARVRGGDVAWLSVWQENPRAVRFYERCGFVVVGSATYLFDGHPESDHLMAIAL